MTRFEVGELSVPKQRPRNNQTATSGSEPYHKIIALESQDSQTLTNKVQENGETNDSFFFHGLGATNGNQNSP